VVTTVITPCTAVECDTETDVGGSGAGGGEVMQRKLQSVQSVPRAQREYSDPAPPSSQSPSASFEHVLVQR